LAPDKGDEDLPTAADVGEALDRIRPHVHRSPVLTSQTLDAMCGARVLFKCENFQRCGAFKFRGACNAVFSLGAEKAARGVATHSSGNHGAALALAARERGIAARVVMPENTSRVKRNAARSYGAEIIPCAPGLAARETVLAEVIRRTGATPVHPYNDRAVIAGQGTAALELLEQVSHLDSVLAPVGGGGLLSGTALAMRWLAPGARVIGVEPKAADDAFRSFQARQLIPLRNPPTVADGLRTSLGPRTFALIVRHVDRIVTVSEAEIVEAMRFVWERMKTVIEPSAAVPVAALLALGSRAGTTFGDRIGVILSGGNVDLDCLPWI
jgi:threonine dehydratase